MTVARHARAERLLVETGGEIGILLAHRNLCVEGIDERVRDVPEVRDRDGDDEIAGRDEDIHPPFVVGEAEERPAVERAQADAGEFAAIRAEAGPPGGIEDRDGRGGELTRAHKRDHTSDRDGQGSACMRSPWCGKAR